MVIRQLDKAILPLFQIHSEGCLLVFSFLSGLFFVLQRRLEGVEVGGGEGQAKENREEVDPTVS